MKGKLKEGRRFAAETERNIRNKRSDRKGLSQRASRVDGETESRAGGDGRSANKVADRKRRGNLTQHLGQIRLDVAKAQKDRHAINTDTLRNQKNAQIMLWF
jgi:hypothetical protein